MIETHHPETEAAWLQLRTQDLTSTEIPALFGMSPYMTPFELWQRKKSGEVVTIADNDRMKWGRRLEQSIAYGIAEDKGWTIRPFKEYMRWSDLRIGSSFDFRTVSLDDSADDAILEIKAVDSLAYKNGWSVEDDFVEAPAHIELQVQHQMLVSGLRRAFIGALIGGNRVVILERERDDAVCEAIKTKAAEFWVSIDQNRAPDPVMPEDAQAVIAMNQHATEGKILQAESDGEIATLVAEYCAASTAEQEAKSRKDAAKARLLLACGDAEKVLLPTGSLSLSMTKPSQGKLITADMVGQYIGARAGFRNFRYTAKKGA